RGRRVRRAEPRGSDEDMVREGSLSRLAPWVDLMADRTALHEDNRVMTVLASHGGGQAHHEFRPGPPRHQFKAAGGKMMAFIDDQMPVIADAIIHHSFANHALNECHIQRSRQPSPPAPESPDGVSRQAEER